MVGVACTLLATSWMLEYYVLGWRGPILALEDPWPGLTYARFRSTYVM